MVLLLKELIDTLWNVNYTALMNMFESSFELIDTLWNVNVYRLNSHTCWN